MLAVLRIGPSQFRRRLVPCRHRIGRESCGTDEIWHVWWVLLARHCPLSFIYRHATALSPAMKRGLLMPGENRAPHCAISKSNPGKVTRKNVACLRRVNTHG